MSNNNMNIDEKWMRIALDEAKIAMNKNEVPVGAVLVHENKLIARAHNQPIKKNDPTAHAEIEVIRKASEIFKNYRITQTTLYVTLEPCAMCYGAMVHARISRIIYGAKDPKSGVCGSSLNLNTEKYFNHQIFVTGGVLEDECKKILKSFFHLRR